ncbi:cell death abnormality protein 1-like [Haliotis asinina]|uniref:cell death abnormality protein 1-like n=1 Tax=Haliotis asinina TaxID=109174 RepID=UPI003531CF31
MVDVVVMTLLCVAVGGSVTNSSCISRDGNNVTCVDGVCLPRCVSVTSSRECLQCLDSRFYGKQCQHDCPDTCLNSRCQLNNTRVVCTEGCVFGKKGDNCGVNCPTACTHCERYGDGCTRPCQSPQYYGPHCKTPCPSNCTGGCNRVTGECGSCEPGYTGDKCDVACPHNCRGGCDKDTGECDSCVEGYCKGGCDEKGDNCDSTSCKTTCRANCKVYDFTQNQCSGPCINANFYGKICTTPCPDNCDKCEKDSARCLNCAPGLRGELCNESCPSNCKLCGRYDNICIGLCHDSNYHGPNCSDPCPVGCKGCEKDTGLCIGCAQSFSRTYCDEMCSPCSENTCHREPCQKRSPKHTLVVSLGVLAGVLSCTVLALIILFRMYLKRRNTDHPTFKIMSRTDSTNVTYSDITDNSVSPSRPTRPALPLTEIPKKRRAVLGASALPEVESVSCCESVQNECHAGGGSMSEQIHQLTGRTDSIIFIEENCDLSNVSVRYLTTDRQT